MLRIVYSSRAADNCGDDHIDELEAVCFRNNWRDGITGLLLHDGSRFMQAIEGRPELVERCFARILADTRHYEHSLYLRRTRAEREFSVWHMRTRRRCGTLSAFRLEVRACVTSISDVHLRAAFMGFASLAS